MRGTTTSSWLGREECGFADLHVHPDHTRTRHWLLQRGHSVTVLTTARSDGTSGHQDAPYPTWFLPAPAGRYSAAWWRESAAAFARLHAAEPFDVIRSQSAGALGYLANLQPQLHVPVVAIMHGSTLGALRQQAYAWPSPRSLALVAAYLPTALLFLWRWRHLGPRLAAVVVPSPELLEHNRRELHLPVDRFRVVPLGVDLDLFAPNPMAGAAARARLGIPPGAQVLLMAGRLTPQKGASVALAALRRLAECHPELVLLFVGSGRQTAKLQRTAGQAGLNERVRFLGQVSQRELAVYYNAADICLFPWLGWEVFPLVLLEALACGRPVIASRIGSAPSILGMAEVGVLVTPGAVDALATAIKRLVATPASAQAMGLAARRLAEASFSIEAMVARTEAVLASCAHRGDGKP